MSQHRTLRSTKKVYDKRRKNNFFRDINNLSGKGLFFVEFKTFFFK